MKLTKDSVVASRYQLVDCLGAGAMGEVWRARDMRFESRTVAVKFLREDETLKEDALNRDRLVIRLEQQAARGGLSVQLALEAIAAALGAGNPEALRAKVQSTLGSGAVRSAAVLSMFDELVNDPLFNDNARMRAKMRRLFRDEANAVANLRHDNIVSIFDYGDHDGSPYLVMDYIEGRTLYQVIQGQENINRSRRLQLIEDLCAGLAYAHRHKLVHRDIKPANLIIDGSTGSLKILDFGVVRRLGSASTVGVPVGTFCYMSPEQTKGSASLDHRSDIFAVGLVFYELMAGRKAFPPGKSIGDLVARIQRDPPPSLLDLNATIPKPIEDIINKAIQKQPENRYQDLSLMEREIARIRAKIEAAEQSEATNLMGSGDVTILKRPGPTIADLLKTAELAFAAGDDRETIDLCKRILVEQPGFAAAVALMGRAETRRRETNLREVVEQAEKFMALGELTAAGGLLNRAREIDAAAPRLKGAEEKFDVGLQARQAAAERALKERELREQREREQRERDLLREQREREQRERQQQERERREREQREREQRERELLREQREREQREKVEREREQREREQREKEQRERERLQQEREGREKEQREREELRERREREQVEREQRERAAREQRAREQRERERLEREQMREQREREKREREEQARREQEERERLAREKAERERQEQLAREKAEREAREKAERERQEQLAREKAEREAREKAERERQERLAREKAEREAREKAERERQERLAREKAEREARERAERERQERLAREKAEREAREKAERERQEQLAREKAEREAREKAERERQEQLAREKAEREAREKAEQEAREKAERQQQEQLARETAEKAERERQEQLAKQQEEERARDERERQERERAAKHQEALRQLAMRGDDGSEDETDVTQKLPRGISVKVPLSVQESRVRPQTPPAPPSEAAKAPPPPQPATPPGGTPRPAGPSRKSSRYVAKPPIPLGVPIKQPPEPSATAPAPAAAPVPPPRSSPPVPVPPGAVTRAGVDPRTLAVGAGIIFLMALSIVALVFYRSTPSSGSPPSATTPVTTVPPAPSQEPTPAPNPTPPVEEPAVAPPAGTMVTVFVDVKPWARVKVVPAVPDAAVPAEPFYAPFAIDLSPGSYNLECENGGLNKPTTFQLTVPEGGPATLNRFFQMPGFNATKTVDSLVRQND